MKTDTMPNSTGAPQKKRTGGIVITVSTPLAFSYGLQMYAIVPAYSTLTTEFGLSYSQVGCLAAME